ncbi:MAG: lysophospholipid acyltransferase family protein [Cytophagales bacterium]
MPKLTSLLQKIFAFYALIVFLGFFLVLYPLLFISSNFRWSKTFNHWMFRIWGYSVFIFTGILAKPTWRFKPSKGQAYVYCANHTSYADIPTLYISIKQDLSFIGKSSLGKIPLFGYVYSRTHILVDRKNADSRREVIDRTKEAIKNGISPVFFPEGTIPKVGKRPEMIDFKDGAFITAIDMQVPVVPVAILNNYLILPDEDMFNVRIKPSKAIFLEPIQTTGMTLDDVNQLKQKTFQAIDKELKINELRHNS